MVENLYWYVLNEHSSLWKLYGGTHIHYALFLHSRFEQAREEADGLRLKNETLEKQLEELDETYTKEREQIEVLHFL